MAKKKLTRHERILARMEDLDDSLQGATHLANIAIVSHKAHLKAEAKAAKETPKFSVGQTKAIEALTAVNNIRQSLTQPIADLIGLAIKEGGGYLSGYEAVVASVVDSNKEADPDFPFHKMALVKLTRNPNSHDYPLNKPVLIIKGDHGVIWDAKAGAWSLGNHMPHDLGCYKSVTAKELAAAAENFDVLPRFFAD